MVDIPSTLRKLVTMAKTTSQAGYECRLHICNHLFLPNKWVKDLLVQIHVVIVISCVGSQNTTYVHILLLKFDIDG